MKIMVLNIKYFFLACCLVGAMSNCSDDSEVDSEQASEQANETTDQSTDDTKEDTSDEGTTSEDTSEDTTNEPEEEPKKTLADLLKEEKTIQQILDAGFSPKDVYTHDNSLLNSLYGNTYEGGLIFRYSPSEENGLVVAPDDDTNTYEWGCALTVSSLLRTSTGINTGDDNTASILEVCSGENIAARICDELVLNGKSDWFLPSSEALSAIEGTLARNEKGNFSGEYWSSSQFSVGKSVRNAYKFDFSTKTDTHVPRSEKLKVRAIRKFDNKE